jgi:outer membrane protein insertion porin family
VPLTEFWQAQIRYSLTHDDVTLDKNTFFNSNGECEPLLAGRYLCDAIGTRLTSAIGYTIAFDNTNNRLRPSAGNRLSISQDFAGLGGDVKYLRTVANASKYWRLTDRFFLGEPQIRGFDIRGVGPRVQRLQYDSTTGTLNAEKNSIVDDALGGRTYYMGRAELEIPLGSGAREMGLRPSIFLDVGSVFGVRKPKLTTLADFPVDPLTGKPTSKTLPILDSSGRQQCQDSTSGALTPLPSGGCAAGSALYGNTIAPFEEQFLGNSPKPRVSVGFGVNWNSPFGPFRIDVARALIKKRGDDTKLFTFNVGTQF